MYIRRRDRRKEKIGSDENIILLARRQLEEYIKSRTEHEEMWC